MSTPIFDPEDPKLTAYALGELTDPAERAEVETLLAASPEARAAVQDIRDVTALLTAEYEQERRVGAEQAPGDSVPLSADGRASAPLTVVPSQNAAGEAPAQQRASQSATTRRAWAKPQLALAAVLLLAGFLAALFVPTASNVLVKRRPQTAHASGWSSLEGVPPKPPATKLFPKEEVSVSPVPEAEPATASAGGTPTGAAVDASKAVYNAAVLASKDSAPGAAAATPPRSVNLFAYQPPVAATRRSTVAPAAEPALPSLANASTAATRQAPQNAFRQLPDQAAATSLSPVFGMNPTGSVRPAEQPLPPVAQAPAAAPMSPIQMNGMGGTGQGMDGTGRGEVATEKKPVTPDLMAKSKFFVTASNRAPEVTQYNTPRVTMWPSDASKAMPPAPADQAEIIREFRYPLQFQPPVVPAQDFNTAAYDHLTENAFLAAKENPLSTFSIDVDTASYANVRRFLDSGSLPPPDAVRVEELLNYFPYDYAPPAPDSGQAFALHLEAASCPWAPEHRLVRVGIKGREVATDKRPASNLVFLIDVSGSMMPPERLPLIKRAMSMLVEHLTENDHVAIVTYAGNSGLALPATSGDHKDAILNALDRLEAGGSTNGASGITLAYRVAREGFIKGGTNRVILATDGDFNVGVTSQGDLIRMIEREAKSGVFLSALGVGTDNYKDSTMQKLADKGNGNYNYIDRLEEARKVLVEQMSGTLLTIAKDVKIQVEFNPAVVGSYRLIGYEKRMLRKEDFNDDRIDAGEIGAGHSVTALYEVVPVGQPLPGAAPAVDALKYGAPGAAPSPEGKPPASADVDYSKRVDAAPEMLTVKMRSKAPDAEGSERAQDVPLTDHGAPGDFAQASPDFRFAAAVAEFGLVLRDSPYKGNATLGAALETAQQGKGSDPKGYRAGFIDLVRKAETLKDAR